jgi:hypothetical protein
MCNEWTYAYFQRWFAFLGEKWLWAEKSLNTPASTDTITGATGTVSGTFSGPRLQLVRSSALNAIHRVWEPTPNVR